MPVPKKRQSKSRKNTRNTTWKNKAVKQVNKVIGLVNFVLKQLTVESAPKQDT